LVAQLTIKTAVWLAGMALLLFASAGTWRWPEGWVYLAELGVIGTAVGVWLAQYDPELLTERMSGIFARSQRSWDRILMSVFVVLWIGSLKVTS